MWEMLLAVNWVHPASLVWKNGHIQLMSVCKMSCTHEGDEGLVKGNKELVSRKAEANSFEGRNVKVQGFHQWNFSPISYQLVLNQFSLMLSLRTFGMKSSSVPAKLLDDTELGVVFNMTWRYYKYKVGSTCLAERLGWPQVLEKQKQWGGILVPSVRYYLFKMNKSFHC